jgi:hypothetical protein
MSDPTLLLRLEVIARAHCDVPTLTARRSDRLDFHNVHCVSLKDALHMAYLLGRKEQQQATADMWAE